MGIAGTLRRANVHGGSAVRRHHETADRVRTLRLNPKQHAFVFSPQRFSFYVGGRGAGKSYAGALRAILRSQALPGSLGLVGAPTHPMLRDAAQRMFFDLCPAALIRSHNKSEQHTVMRNGAEILWRPAFEYDRYRGLNLAWFWLDEAPWCGYDAWKILKATLRQSGFETAAWATGTPRGRDGYARDFEGALRRKGHALYRASTRENLHNLPEGFIEDLGYEGQFAEQEIEGLFVSFDGLVYRFEAASWEDAGGHLRRYDGTGLRRVIGGIDWGYTNPTAAVVVGLDGDRRAWQLDEFYQRRASMEDVVMPALVRLTKQHNVSRWYADSEDPEAIDKLNRALAEAGVACRAVAAVKGPGSVRAGIQTVTAALAQRADGSRGLYVDPRCVNTIAEYGSYAYATAAERSKRDPSEEPLKQADHCFVAGTPVLTEAGNRPIETILPGDSVWTRKGLRRVLAAGCTDVSAQVYRVEFSNGAHFDGTGNHPVLVVGHGWIPLDPLRYNMQVEVACIGERSPCLLTARTSIRSRSGWAVRSWCNWTVSRSGVTLRIRATARGTITRRGRGIGRGDTSRTTVRSGSAHMGRFPTGTTFTTRTGTRSTIGLITWNVCRARSICCGITASGSRSVSPRSGSGWRRYGRWRLIGTPPRKGWRGIVGTARQVGRDVSLGRFGVTSAGRSSRAGMACRVSIGSARTGARLRGGGLLAPMMRRACVRGACVSSKSIGMRTRGVARSHAASICCRAVRMGYAGVRRRAERRVRASGAESPMSRIGVSSVPARVHVVSVSAIAERQAVYNLTVEGQPEYYAAGVLVHNCLDATRYALHGELAGVARTEAYLAEVQRLAAGGAREEVEVEGVPFY